jgi:1-acyl-sn-glycerol-3-phosphate acyltransferase
MAVNREDIEKPSFFYSLLKPYVDFVTTTYFRTSIHNKKNIPKDEIIIYTPNHQNALMDALALLTKVDSEPVFLARADIFKKPAIAKILTFLRILPIYRIRDGKDSLGNNEAIFRKTVDILKNKNGLVILPEGNHAGIRKLRTLKKGVSRIVFEAEESNDFKLNIKIVPVGLDWSHYSNFRSRLFINFGEPISVSEYYEEYKKHPARGMNLLRERVASELKKYMIHIENEEYYDMFDSIRYLFLPQMTKKMGVGNKQPHQFYAQKNIIKNLNEFVESNPEETKELANKTSKYSELLMKLNFRHWVMQKAPFSVFGTFLKTLFALLFLPIYLIGGIINYLPYKIPVWLTKNVKDPQFVSSVRNVIAIILFPLYYIILIIAGSFIAEPWWLKLSVLVFLPFAGLFAFIYYIEVKKLCSRMRFTFKTWFKNKDLQDLKDNYYYICTKMDTITK